MAANNGQQNNNEGSPMWRRVLIFLAMYWMISSVSRRGPAPVPGDSANPVSTTVGIIHNNTMPAGTMLDMWTFISEQNDTFFPNNEALVWKEEEINYGSWDESVTRKKSIEITPSKAVQNNGTLYSHTFWVNSGFSPIEGSENFQAPLLSHVHQLNRYIKRAPVRKTQNLISGDIDEEYLKRKKWEEENNMAEDVIQILSYWKGNLTLSLVTDHSQFPDKAIPPHILKHMKFDENGNYHPVVFGNEFWLLNEDLMPINDTVETLKLDMVYEPIGLVKWNFLVQMDESFSMQRNMFGAGEHEADNLKRVLLDNDPYILGFTFSISFVHMILDTLAFKNEIQFWKNKKSMEGMSVRSIYVNFVCQVIILLYLLDNPDTSWMVLFSVVLGVFIEGWKVTRAVHVTIGWKGAIPYPVFTDKQSYSGTETKKYDLESMKYLYWALYPLIAIYAIYSMVYETHKNWYSFLVKTAAGCVYTFGFIMMTPQLFINYKLKSVAHLPWRVFVYKAISTFIDDLFAFLIRMPTLHRLRVFRDDIVFLIYLYQRWIYPVDSKRVEVGTEFADVDASELELFKQQQEQKAKVD